MEIATLIICVISCLLSLTAIILIFIRTKEKTQDNSAVLNEVRASRQETTQNVNANVTALGEVLKNSQAQTADVQDKRLRELNEMISAQQSALRETVNESIAKLETQFKTLSGQTEKSFSAIQTGNEKKLDEMRLTVTESITKLETQFRSLSEQTEKRLSLMQEGNEKKLDEMRLTVDEKLQKTLEERINKSFELVCKNLDEVSKGLGEMKTLANDVGGLKKVLTNVKTCGIVGEIRLGAILEEILSPEQYKTNIATVPGSTKPVEFAVKLPGNDDKPVYLPIDSKFPLETYRQLEQAYENGDPAEVKACRKTLSDSIKSFAKDIHTKYIAPPDTTDFAIMFLPVESLYAEVVSSGLVEILQHDYKINIAGPTTMAAMLNSLQMGFRTLAIQKRSGEVWTLLGTVRTEFEKFGAGLEKAQKKIEETGKELDSLVGVRTRAINKSLKKVSKFDEFGDNAQSLQLPLSDDDE